MASVTSLGLHKPSAIPFLVAEGILPSEPADHLYTWQTANQDGVDGDGEVEEELVTTKYCVVWSRGGVIQRVFRFEIEREAITQAVFAKFPLKQHQKPPGYTRFGSSKHTGADLFAKADLSIKKSRASAPSPRHRVSERFQSSSLDDGHIYSLLGSGISHNEEVPDARALFVVLKTQAHVFFLSGTSHIVNLPFEVDVVFPLIHGVLLQRKLHPVAAVPPTPQLPSVPPNSFAMSNPSFSETISSSQSQGQNSLANMRISAKPDQPFQLLLTDLFQRSTPATKSELPRVFCLTDPLSEMGIVTTGMTTTIEDPIGQHRRPTGFDALDEHESLVYVSSEDELGCSKSAFSPECPLLLAVTINQQTGVYTLWNLAYVDSEFATNSKRRLASAASGTLYRRRSSYGPGAGTGANTPMSRSAVVGRESFGRAKTCKPSSQEDILEQGSIEDQEGLISQLDPAFENPAMPAKSSRRVSSLLARADLSTSHDRTAFTDLAGSHSTKPGTRRSMYSSRLSAGLESVVGHNRSQPTNGLRSSFGGLSSHESSFEDTMDDSESVDDLEDLSSLGLNGGAQGLRREMILSKIQSIPGEGANSEHSSINQSKSCRTEIFTMRPPIYSLAADDYNGGAVSMCLVDRAARTLIVLQIALRAQSSSRNAKRSHRQTPGKVSQISQPYNIGITSSTKASGIIDASKIIDGAWTRILVLSETVDGMGELSLQAPWGAKHPIKLPISLCVNDPYRVSNGVSLRQRREGGYKRVLSHGPQALVALRHRGNRGQVDVVDSYGSRHRIQIQLEPHDPVVRKILKLCTSVLPDSERNRDSILGCWWDVMSWLHNRPEEEIDTEWTAMATVLFSMAVNFIEHRHTETATRQKKRKGGLLRSSSGANTDLESWEAMMGQEGSGWANSPPWMQDEAWHWTAKNDKTEVLPDSSQSKKSRLSRTFTPFTTTTVPIQKKFPFLVQCISLAREFMTSPKGLSAGGEHGYLPTASSRDSGSQRTALATILVSLHLLREEFKLDVLAANILHKLAPILAQIGTWLSWGAWGASVTSYSMLESSDMESWVFEDSVISKLKIPPAPFEPPSILRFLENVNLDAEVVPFISLLDLVSPANEFSMSKKVAEASARILMDLTPRTLAITTLLCRNVRRPVDARVTEMASWGLNLSILETLPESVAVFFRAALSRCQAQPSTTWDRKVLETLGRDDIAMLELDSRTISPHVRSSIIASNEATRDVHTICNSTLEVETIGAYDGSAESDRQSITRMIFKDDQRFAEAAKLVHPLHAPEARCTPEPNWSDTDLLEAQQELVKTVAVRTLSVSLGRGLIFYSARLPLLTEKFPIHGFTLSCVMKPTNTTVTADRNQYTEEKVSWAFFHAGVEAGLSISRDARGIDTSWILFNKPQELKNRHAGFLLALGLNGHLKSIAKWVAFKYLTPKHTMTSIGLLLGLSASYLGTMDTLITRLLSVHVMRMLPPGAAELNLSPLTQTSGVMGIGLLYCNTQHRRMSEIMLSEMENVDQEDNSSPHDCLRDEGYRLAAGFALGLINLGRGKDLKGLHDMHIVERLLALATGTKKVNLVHILDKATAAATVALALMFMKTHDVALAQKIDIPNTVHQFDYVRPDIFLLRTVARNLIMWNEIQASDAWMKIRLPSAYQHKLKLTSVRALNTEDMPFFNIVAGLCFSIGLRYAGTGSYEVRNLLSYYLDQYIRICRLPAGHYDGKLIRITVRNCQNVVALSAACVMAGTGDLRIFRRLRSLHGKIDVDTPYGSHLAAHFAIGILFLGGGTHTFGTSNIAVASLLCAFYPLFPNTILDNKSHLQAFRHLWVLATEARCLIPRDVDTLRPASIPILVTLLTGTELAMTAPCLLPELDTISKIQTQDPEFWRITLYLADNSNHREAFKRHQSIYLRRRAAYDSHASVFSATMQALNDDQSALHMGRQAYDWIFRLAAFEGFDRAEQALVLPPDVANSLYRGTRNTVVDDRLMLETGCVGSGRSERLWNLRILFAWAEGLREEGKEGAWLGREVVERLRAKVEARRNGIFGR